MFKTNYPEFFERVFTPFSIDSEPEFLDKVFETEPQYPTFYTEKKINYKYPEDFPEYKKTGVRRWGDKQRFKGQRGKRNDDVRECKRLNVESRRIHSPNVIRIINSGLAEFYQD